ncbi:potassium channel family protein [Propionibacteriaceae bacterium Y1923]
MVDFLGRGARATSRLTDSVVVIGLGRFGESVALELMAMGADVLGVETKEDVVQRLNGELTHVVKADATSEEVLRQLGVDEADTVVVAIGDSIEASILTCSLVLSLGVKQVWAKAVSDTHGRVLSQIGVQRVVHPEREIGKRVAHQLRAKLADFIDLDGGFALVRTSPPRQVLGRSVGEIGVRKRYGVTIIAARRPGQDWSEVTEQTQLQADDEIVVTGPTDKAERFHLM